MIWLWVYEDKICIYHMFHLLKGGYRFLVLSFTEKQRLQDFYTVITAVFCPKAKSRQLCMGLLGLYLGYIGLM